MALLSLTASALAPTELPAVPEGNDWIAFESFDYAGRDPVFERTPLPAGHYYNPVVAGYFPDPSICRVGEDYYLVNSSFSHFPGVPIFHSRDLVNWNHIGHVLDRPSQLNLDGLPVSSGIFAPTIEHHAGTFYMITTNVRGIGNFYVTATDPAGPWSDPIPLSFDGIDPSFFFDEDGKIYVVHNGPPPDNKPLYDGHRAIWLWEFDPVARKVKDGRIVINGGVDLSQKPVWIEGPHIFRRNGWYYLTCAEGGTGPAHSQVIFRTRSLSEPFVPGPRNPILTQRDLDPRRPHPVIALGHADMVQTQQGEWWAVFLGIRPYEGGKSNIGRETFLLPVTWEDDWPMMLEPGAVMPVSVKRPSLSSAPLPRHPTTGSFAWHDDFGTSELGRQWLFLRTPRERWWNLDSQPGNLLLRPRPVNLHSVPRKDPKLNGNPSFVARRLQHVDFQAETTVRVLNVTPTCDAGLAALQNDTNYLFLGIRVRGGNATEVFLERRDRSSADATILATAALDPKHTRVALRLEGSGKSLAVHFRTTETSPWNALATDIDGSLLSTEAAGGFVGAVVGLYARTP